MVDDNAGPDAVTSEWDWGWEAHRQAQAQVRADASYEQRLAWLEDAITFAHATGALRPVGPTRSERLA